MLIDRKDLEAKSKATLGVKVAPIKFRRAQTYKSSPLKKRSEIINKIVGISLLVALLFGGAYMVYTIGNVGRNILDRKIENANKPAENEEEQISINVTYKPAKK